MVGFSLEKHEENTHMVEFIGMLVEFIGMMDDGGDPWMMEFMGKKISNPGINTCFWEPGTGLRFCLCDLGLLWLGVEKVKKSDVGWE